MHRTQDTYPLSHFRQHTAEHVKRVSEGAVETITQNGRAALVVMSPARYDALVLAAERGPMWRAALDRLKAGDEGRDAREVLKELADEFDVRL